MAKKKKKKINHPHQLKQAPTKQHMKCRARATYLSQSDRSYAAEAWNTAGSECLQSSIGMDFQQNVRREDEKRWTNFFPVPVG